MTHYGDPDFESAPVNGLAHPDFAARRRSMRVGKALPWPVEAGDPWPYERFVDAPERIETRAGAPRLSGTSQAAAADREGNVASICMSIGGSFGSLVHVPELGIVLNNAMQNFDPRPDHPNAIKPGKMPIFAAPVLAAARQGEGRFAGAGSGGYRIQSAVLHAFMNVVDHRMRIQRAIDHPRVHCQGRETWVDARIPRRSGAASPARDTRSSWSRKIRAASTSPASARSPGSRAAACCGPARGRCGVPRWRGTECSCRGRSRETGGHRRSILLDHPTLRPDGRESRAGVPIHADRARNGSTARVCGRKAGSLHAPARWSGVARRRSHPRPIGRATA